MRYSIEMCEYETNWYFVIDLSTDDVVFEGDRQAVEAYVG